MMPEGTAGSNPEGRKQRESDGEKKRENIWGHVAPAAASSHLWLKLIQILLLWLLVFQIIFLSPPAWACWCSCCHKHHNMLPYNPVKDPLSPIWVFFHSCCKYSICCYEYVYLWKKTKAKHWNLHLKPLASELNGNDADFKYFDRSGSHFQALLEQNKQGCDQN